MKKLMFLVAASLFVFAACSSEDDPSSEVNPENNGITFELSAVNGLTDGIGTRMPVYSQEGYTACHLCQCLCFYAERFDLSAAKDL